MFNSNFQQKTPMSSRVVDESLVPIRPQEISYKRVEFMPPTQFSFDSDAIDTSSVYRTRMENLNKLPRDEGEIETVSFYGEEEEEEPEMMEEIIEEKPEEEEEEEEISSVPENRFCFY